MSNVVKAKEPKFPVQNTATDEDFRGCIEKNLHGLAIVNEFRV